MTRNNHRHHAVPVEIVAEGSNPVSVDSAEEFVVDAEPTDPGAQPDSADAVTSDQEPVEASSDETQLEAELDSSTLRKLLEALVFAADKPISLQRLRQLTRVSEVSRIQEALAELATEYQDRGIALHEVSGGYQFRTNTAFSAWVQQLIAGRPVRLSRAQLETLAIVAYRQPITRPEIDEIRGVDSSATLRLLLDRALVRILGKREEVGRPMLYGTTKEFLEFFSLTDLRELPTLREYSELTAESRKVVSERLGVTEPAATMAAASAELSANGVEASAAIEAFETVVTSSETMASADLETSAEMEAPSELDASNEMDASADQGVDASSEPEVASEIDASADERMDASSEPDVSTGPEASSDTQVLVRSDESDGTLESEAADEMQASDAVDTAADSEASADSEVSADSDEPYAQELTEIITPSEVDDLAGTFPAGRASDDEESE